MNRRNSLSRFSFSASNISSPIAESTHISNLRNSDYHTQGNGKFFDQERSMFSENGFQNTLPKIGDCRNGSVDPKVYTDVQSRGLVSRIIKYHDDSKKLNRSLSSSSLYNKPGEFPIVHLKKNEIRYYPRRNQIASGVRIAPPDKSVFQTITRSSILSSGTLVSPITMEKSDDKDSRENEPILPPTETDINPARSSLEALKEISRKRINSDDLNGTDANKKYCKEFRYGAYNPGSSKRQREPQTSPQSKQNDVNSERVIKKRMFNKNNDIISSLSSSLNINSPKRKLCDIQPKNILSTPSSPTKSSVSPKAKQQCSDNNYIQSANNLNINHKQQNQHPVVPAVIEPKKPSFDVTKVVVENTQKPKLTLFNKNYDTIPKIITSEINDIDKSINSDGDDCEEETKGILFVQPKENKLSLPLCNGALDTQKKTRLQLMLKYLSGELNDENRDEVDTTKQHDLPNGIEVEKDDRVLITTTPPKEIIQTESEKVSQPKSTQFNFGSTPATSNAGSGILTDSTINQSTPSTATLTSANNVPVTSQTPIMVSSAGFSFGISKVVSSEPSQTVKPLTSITSDNSNLKPAASFTFGNTPTSAVQVQSSVPTSSTASAAPATSFTIGSSNNITIEPTKTGTFNFGIKPLTTAIPSSNAVPVTMAASSVAPPSSTVSTSIFTSGLATSKPSVPSALVFGTSGGFTTGNKNNEDKPNQPAPIIFGSSTMSDTITTVNIFGTKQNSTTSNATSQPIPFGIGSKNTENQLPGRTSTTTTSVANNISLQSSTFGVLSPATSTLGNIFGNTSTSFSTLNKGSNFENQPNPNQQSNQPATTSIFAAQSSTPAQNFGNNAFNLAVKSATTSTDNSKQQSIFGSDNATKEASPFSFGNNNTEPTNSNNVFGKTPFTFNSNSNNPAAQAVTTTSSFSFTSNVSTINAVAQNTTPFGFASQNTTNTNNNQGPSPFSFNAPKTESNNNANNNTSGGFNFQTNPSKTIFGNVNNENKPSFGFGQTNTTSANTPFSFKSPATTNIQSNTSNTNSTAPQGAFSFSTGHVAEGKNLFGNTSNNTPAKPGSTSSFPGAFAFGSANDNKNSQTPNPPFGNPTSNVSKSFNFTNTNTNPPSSNIFGSVAGVNTNTSSSIFGSNTPVKSNQPFTFTSNNSAASNQQQNNAAPFAFGASGPSAALSTGNQEKENKPFTFGAPNQGGQLTTSTPFGNTNLNKPSATFTNPAAAAGASNPFASPTTNVFSVGPSGGSGFGTPNIHGRQTRTATRRLK